MPPRMSVLLSNRLGVAATQVKTMIGSLTPEAGVVCTSASTTTRRLQRATTDARRRARMAPLRDIMVDCGAARVGRGRQGNVNGAAPVSHTSHEADRNSA